MMARLFVSPAAAKIGNFNGVSAAVVVFSASLSNLLGLGAGGSGGGGGGHFAPSIPRCAGYSIKGGGTDPLPAV